MALNGTINELPLIPCFYIICIFYIYSIFKLNKTRTRGRPHQHWLDQIKKDLDQVNETAIIEDTDNRDWWRGLVEAAKGLNGLKE